jgi:hypothetical protein
MPELKKSVGGKYVAKDVEQFISNLRKEYEVSLKDQRKRIVDLRDENRALKTSLNDYKQNEKSIFDAMVNVEKHKQSLIDESQQKVIMIESDAQEKIDFYNRKLSTIKQTFFDMEDHAINLLQNIVLEISNLREQEIIKECTFHIDPIIEKMIQQKKIV